MTATVNKKGANIDFDWDEVAQLRGIILHYKVYLEAEICKGNYSTEAIMRMARAIDRNENWLDALNKI